MCVLEDVQLLVMRSWDHVYINKPFIFIADDVTVFTVATEDNHGLQRFLRSAQVYGIDVQVLGSGQEWQGGDMTYAGGGHKVNLLKQRLNEMIKSENKEKIILFVDRYFYTVSLKFCNSSSNFLLIHFPCATAM